MAQAAEMAVELLEGRTELLERLLEQLVAQRLAGTEWVRTSEWFRRELQSVIRSGIERYRTGLESREAASPEVLAEAQAEAGEPAPPAAEPGEREECAGDPLRRALALLFPGREVRERYAFHGTLLDYFLPQERLALAVEGRPGVRPVRQEYFCRQEGITLVVLDPATAEDAWQAARFIRRALGRTAVG